MFYLEIWSEKEEIPVNQWAIFSVPPHCRLAVFKNLTQPWEVQYMLKHLIFITAAFWIGEFIGFLNADKGWQVQPKHKQNSMDRYECYVQYTL